MKNIVKFLIIPLVALLSTVSCDEEEKGEFTPERLFRPFYFRVGDAENLGPGHIDGTSVRVTWAPISGATYRMEIYEIEEIDEDNENEIYRRAIENIPATWEYTLTDLEPNTIYMLRIQSISADPEIKNSEFQQLRFRTMAN